MGRAKPLKPAGPSVRFADWGCLQEAFGQEWGEAIRSTSLRSLLPSTCCSQSPGQQSPEL